MQVPFFNISVKALMFGSSVLGSIYTLSTCFIQIYQGGKGKNGSTVAVSCVSFSMLYIGNVTSRL